MPKMFENSSYMISKRQRKISVVEEKQRHAPHQYTANVYTHDCRLR